MEDERLPTPGLAQPKWFGQPYHGLVVNGELTLSTGRKIEVLGASGDCYIVKVPGTPPVDISPQERAREAAAGREWRTYALLSGRDKHYGGIVVGADAWLYAAADGTVWRIRCPQLDTTTCQPTPEPGLFFGFFPAAMDFTFEVERFGLVAGDALADRAVVTVVGQSLGVAHRSDIFRDPADGPPEPASRRRFPGDGFLSQWMPINIEDVNSDGSRCLICCNRSAEQGAANLPRRIGRAYPLTWIEISVSGSGAASQIGISMDVVKVQSMQEVFSEGSVLSYTDVPAGATFSETIVYWTNSGGEQFPAAYQYSNLHFTYSAPVLTGYSLVSTVEPRTAGGFYDANDALQWAVLGPVVIDSAVTMGVSRSFRDEATHSYQVSAYGETFTQVDASGYVEEATSAHQRITATASATIAGEAYAIPPLDCEVWASRLTYSFVSAGPNAPGGVAPAEQFSVTARIGSVFGTMLQESGDWNAFEGAFLLSPMGGFGVNPGPTNVIDSVSARTGDNVRLVRMSNKTYALMARMEFSGWPSYLQEKVIAIGTPDGWITVDQLLLDYHASYNPGTGDIAHNGSDSLGWV